MRTLIQVELLERTNGIDESFDLTSVLALDDDGYLWLGRITRSWVDDTVETEWLPVEGPPDHEPHETPKGNLFDRVERQAKEADDEHNALLERLKDLPPISGDD